jgi:hypothetical protein
MLGQHIDNLGLTTVLRYKYGESQQFQKIHASIDGIHGWTSLPFTGYAYLAFYLLTLEG